MASEQCMLGDDDRSGDRVCGESRDVTDWFVDGCFEASGLSFCPSPSGLVYFYTTRGVTPWWSGERMQL